jgi:hypothetical protein
MNLGDLFQAAGSLAGVFALLWRIRDEFGSYLRISLKVSPPEDNNWITILSTLDNKGLQRKNLEWACLLIGPETESPIETTKLILNASGIVREIRYTNDLFSIKNSCPFPGLMFDCRALIPLPFFYSENIAIGDETLTYKSPVNISRFPKHVPISVRLFVFGRGRLHRSTHTCFIVGLSEAKV